MRKILDEILWNIYYLSERPTRRGDLRFIIVNEILKDTHIYTGKQLITAVVDLSKEKFIQKKKDYEGNVLVSLTEKGVLRAISYKFRRFEHKKEKWDGKWRMIAFDIPRECQKGRKALVYRLKSGGFYRLQESIFLYPYDCKNELAVLVKLFKIEKYIRFGILDFIDNQEKIKLSFKL
jgi:DNA-binding transcriptional regulator PaaX